MQSELKLNSAESKAAVLEQQLSKSFDANKQLNNQVATCYDQIRRLQAENVAKDESLSKSQYENQLKQE